MKKFLVIGNPIKHSLSPLLHNYWIKKNNINAIYNKEQLDEIDLKDFFLDIKYKKITGANVTVPFKKKVIPFLDQLTPEAKETQSVNTIYLKNNKVVGHNTDSSGFELAIKETKKVVLGKKILILGAGGVVSSIIFALNKMKASNIIISNRTKTKAKSLQNLFKNLTVVDWGEIPDFDIVINATSVGLNRDDKLNLDFSIFGKGKFYYDIIYNPKQTNFLKIGRELGGETQNGKEMFIYQAAEAFKTWHGIEPEVTDEIKKLLDI